MILHFSLLTLTDPYLRGGLHGLARTLRMEGNEHYPEIRQTDTLHWTMTDTDITIEAESVDDLHRLMSCQSGDHRHGLAVPPGYETDPDHPGAYMTVRAHQGCTQVFFSKRGKHRSSSWSIVDAKAKDNDKNKKKAEDKKKAKEKARESHLARYGEPRTKIICADLPDSTEDNPKNLKMSFTPNMRAPDPPSFELTAKGAIADKQPVSILIHPAFGKWNDVPVKIPWEDYFLLSFSLNSHVWTMSLDGLTGLSIDADTFSEADTYFNLWLSTHDKTVSNVLFVNGNAHTAAWFIAAALNLPDRTYAVTSGVASDINKKTFLFNPSRYHGDRVLIYDVIGKSISPRSKNGMIRGTNSIPLKTEIKEKKEHTLRFFNDQLIFNLESCAPWYRDLGSVATVARSKKTGLYRYEAEHLAQLAAIFENRTPEGPMERRIRLRMKSLYDSLIVAQHERFHPNKKSPDSWQDARKRAHDITINVYLNRAFNKASLLDALCRIKNEAGPKAPFFDIEEADWLSARTETNPADIRALLMFACETRIPSKKGTASDTTSDEDTNTSDTTAIDEMVGILETYGPNQED